MTLVAMSAKNRQRLHWIIFHAPSGHDRCGHQLWTRYVEWRIDPLGHRLCVCDIVIQLSKSYIIYRRVKMLAPSNGYSWPAIVGSNEISAKSVSDIQCNNIAPVEWAECKAKSTRQCWKWIVDCACICLAMPVSFCHAGQRSRFQALYTGVDRADRGPNVSNGG